MSQWVTHRDPRLWDDPLRFDPDRWAEGATRPEGFAYFPFSSGPHACHGSQQALLEATIVAATISQRWRLRTESDKEPAMTLGIGLQPKKPLQLIPVARSSPGSTLQGRERHDRAGGRRPDTDRALPGRARGHPAGDARRARGAGGAGALPGPEPDYIALGNVLQAANGQNPGRQAALAGGVRA